MNREIHVRFWEGLGVRFPWATRLFSSKCAFDPFVPPREFRGEGLACDAGRYHTDLAVKATPGGARCARP